MRAPTATVTRTDDDDDLLDLLVVELPLLLLQQGVCRVCRR